MNFALTGEEIILATTGAGAILVNAMLLSAWIGRLSAQVKANAADISGLADIIRNEIKLHREDLEKDFKNMCEGKQENCREKMQGFIDSRNLIVKENQKEHSVLFAKCEDYDLRLKSIERNR